ncbi:hypothetical protein STRDD10_00417 [Streptococcus sp. DD10]|uniref:phage tail tip lysozyme n=1 Tax=Streptococcus sp. DD10 TaxID=1777878 RepID=UPI000794B6EE|nr:phage tail tip lysozyme [Streptococcus sp. DD10]KXT75181.1 hypothetical protein STRDD10_00417 [Streptococcus sp. DD10]
MEKDKQSRVGRERSHDRFTKNRKFGSEGTTEAKLQSSTRPNTSGHRLDQRLEQAVKNHRIVREESSARLHSMRENTRSKGRIVRESKREVKDQAKRVKTLKKSLKTVQKELTATKDSPRYVRDHAVSGEKGTTLRTDVRYRLVKKGKAVHHQRGKISKEAPRYVASEKIRARTEKKYRQIKVQLKQAKLEKKISKKTHKKAVAYNGGSRKKKFLRASKQTFERAAGTQMDAASQSEDVLGDIVDAKHKYQQVQMNWRRSKTIGRLAGKGATGAVKHTYGLGNRFYNLKKGRGFTRAPRQFSWEGRLARRMAAYRKRLAQSATGRIYNGGRMVFRAVKKPFVTILKNPFSIKAYVTAFLLLLFFSFLGIGSSGIARQDEFDLTNTWTHFTKLDRDKSTDKVDYWTKIDNPLLYINYRYEHLTDDFRINDDQYLTDNQLAKMYLDNLWENLNGDKDNLRTMEDLYKNQDPFKLSQEDLEEYEELLEIAKETGKYMLLQELDNPFYKEDETNYDSPLVITKRFGYETKDDLYEGSIIKATAGQTILAVAEGEVTVDGEEVTIKDKDSEFTYKSIDSIRVKSGDKVTIGEQIGKINSQGGLEVYYKKLRKIKGKPDEWLYVNPGFYFHRVEYSQTTSVISDINLAGDVMERIKAIYNFIKNRFPEATDEAIASILGNWLVESNITSKRAEGDYLSPPVGATNSSWDDPNWLNMGNMEIYQGAYPNIIHRGLGLGQWTDTADGSVRHTMLLDFAKSKNKKWYDLELQLEFMFDGDAPYYTNFVKNFLTQNDGTDAMTNSFLVYWEGNSGDKLAQRQAAAKQMLQYIKSGFATGGSTKFPGSGQPLDVPYVITQLFGVNANNGIYGGAGHTGMDLAAPEGSPIYAVTDGEVVDVNGGYMHINGNYVLHSLPDGTYIYYGHMRDVPLVRPGDKVKQGQLIGYVGMTGLATGPHIHFERRPTPAFANHLQPSGLIMDGEPRVGMVIDPSQPRR